MHRRRTFIAIALVVMGAVFWQRHAETNDERAYFAKDGPRYRVEMKGWRFPMVHDPLSLLLERTYETTFTLALPRIEGTIQGAEIPVPADQLGYVGRVVISNGTMTLDLYYDDPGDSIRRALSWNDEYTLVPKDAGASR